MSEPFKQFDRNADLDLQKAYEMVDADLKKKKTEAVDELIESIISELRSLRMPYKLNLLYHIATCNGINCNEWKNRFWKAWKAPWHSKENRRTMK